MVKEKVPKRYSPSMEDYLEAIAMLHKEKKLAKVSTLSRRLKVKMPSVTSALKKLSQRGLVVHERYGYVGLTSKGDEVAQDVIRRHKALSRFFTEALNINEKTAEEDASKIEHVISPLGLERVTKFIEFINACPLGQANFPKRYKYYLDYGELPKECLERGLRKQ
jgi:DtxR family Mn-dependent transcriptional regulator